MAVKVEDQDYTYSTAENGAQYASGTETTLTDTLEDGTEVVAEITTSASADDPTNVESHMTYTETAPDGTITEREVVANKDGTFLVEDESALEEIVEAVFDVEIGDEMTPIDAHGNPIERDVNDDSSYGFADPLTGETDTVAIGETLVGGRSYETGTGEVFDVDGVTYETSTGMTDDGTTDDIYTATSDESGDNSYNADYSEDTTSVAETDSAVEEIEQTADASAEAQERAEYNAEYAEYYQEQADVAADSALDYAEHGYGDTASVYAESADNHQEMADQWADAPTDE